MGKQDGRKLRRSRTGQTLRDGKDRLQKEETKDGRKVWITDFTLKETATEELIAGYAKSVWEACIEADGNQMHRDNRAYYDDLAEARRRQEPFDYYLWYYFAADREFRLSITASEMERNAPGGLVLRIEEWK